MPEITALTPSARRRGRMRVYVDGRFLASVDELTLAMHGLKVGLIIGHEAIAALERDVVVNGLVDRTLRFLSFRPRSEAELRAYLRRLEATPDQVEATVSELRRQGLVDDEAFARFWRDARDRAAPRGERLLRAELRSKGVQSDVVDEVLPDDDEQAVLARRAADGRLRQFERLPWPEFRLRLLGFLQRRGFDYDVANRTVRDVWETLAASAPPEEDDAR